MPYFDASVYMIVEESVARAWKLMESARLNRNG